MNEREAFFEWFGNHAFDPELDECQAEAFAAGAAWQARASAVPQWQPIETAPKHGRALILLLTPSRFPQVAYSNTWWTGGFSVECQPTHWMPLPAAPKETT